MSRHSIRKWIGLGLAAFPLVAVAHIQLLAPKPRAGSSGTTSGTRPCGGTLPGTATQLDAGQLLTVKWIETIYHGPNSEYRISYSANQTTMSPLVPLTNFLLEDAGLTLLADGGHEHTWIVRVPTMTSCINCSLQVFEDGGNGVQYFQCADVSWGGLGDGGTIDAGSCDPTNCLGCCDATDTCVPGSTDSECGTGGAACVACSGGSTCDGVTHQCLGGAQDSGPATSDAGGGGPPEDAGSGTGGGGGGCGCGTTGGGALALVLLAALATARARRSAARG